MNTPHFRLAFGGTLLAAVALVFLGLIGERARGEPRPKALPRFTEEREAAALFFVRKQLPDLLPLLDELKKNQRQHYEQQISRIFQATEILADLDDPRRDLELKIWKAENKAHLLIARMNVQSEAERKALQEQLQALASELVSLEIQVLELRSKQLEAELEGVKKKLEKSRENAGKLTQERYESFLEKVKKAAK